jgi:bacterial leucyl aminopeptidase
MVGVSKLTVFGAVLLQTPLALAAVASDPRPILSKPSELRLVKISENDPGTWMTEEEKFEKLTSKRIGFMDITDTMVRNTHHFPHSSQPRVETRCQSSARWPDTMP